MKQLFLILSVVVLAFGLTSCGGYDLKKCEQLQEKIQSGDDLTQDDYAEMISQAQALNAYLCGIADKMADVKDGDDFQTLSEESAEQGNYYQKFVNRLESAEMMDELEGANVDAYKELKNANEVLNDRLKNAFEAAFKAGGAAALGQ